MTHHFVCLAGTFDGIHAGHEALLRKAFEIGERVIIGLTSDFFVSSFKVPRLPMSLKSPIASYDKRKQTLIRWLDSHDYLYRASIVPIDDPYEPAASDSKLDALVVSEETRDRGEKLNAVRIKNRLQPLTLIVVPMVPAEDTKSISATRVRVGEIDRNGRLIMPENLRNDLVRPLGPILSGQKLADTISKFRIATPSPRSRLSLEMRRVVMTVGDQTTYRFISSGVMPDLMIIDHKVNRQPFSNLKPLLQKYTFATVRVKSGPGFISCEAIEQIKRLLDNKDSSVLEVEGEEDLLVLPAIIEAPLGAIVYYGQPKSGMVEVIITHAVKQKIKGILEQFEI